MSIERTPPQAMQPIVAVDNGRSLLNERSSARSQNVVNSAGSQVQLSDEVQKAQQPAEDIRPKQVEKIKAAIAQGKLTFDPEKVAHALLKNNIDLFNLRGEGNE